MAMVDLWRFHGQVHNFERHHKKSLFRGKQGLFIEIIEPVVKIIENTIDILN
jgi:hypothetical protein